MNDDALSPVVAMMLVLTVVVSLFSLWNTIYLPGLKQQSEVQHLKQVEEGMVRIDSAIRDAIFYKHNGSLSIPVPLGGGDIMFNNLRSGGELKTEISENEAVIKLTINESSTYEVYLSNVTYTPVSNFWIAQGYTWQDGVVNVTKGNVTTPLLLERRMPEEQAKFAKDLITVTNRDGFTIAYVNMTPSTRNVISGNGIAQFGITVISSVPVLLYNVTNVTLEFSGSLPTSLYNTTNSSLAANNNLTYKSTNYPQYMIYHNNSPTVNLNLERLDIVLSVE